MLEALLLTVVMSGAGQLPPGQQLPTNLPPSNRVKDPARPDFGYNPWAGTQLTVAVVYSIECEPCDASVPFYKRLAALPGIDGKRRSFVVITQGGIAPVADLIESRPDGFKLGRVASYPDDDRFGVTQTPTVRIFDGAWKRRGQWSGKLSPAQENEVLAMITAITSGKDRR